MPHNTFSKKQRLKSRKKLQQVFAAKQAVYAKQVKLVYLIEDTKNPGVKCGVGLSGRNFKKAVDRNRVKRLLREAYRVQQHELQEYAQNHQKEISIFFLYTGKELPQYEPAYNWVGDVLKKLIAGFH
ncbi:MAG: ribonuclease P protein component [Niabella sp.]